MPLTYFAATHCAVIVVNYGAAADTVACLRALAAMPVQPGLVIVVDNHSPDDSAARILRQWGTFAAPLLLRETDAAAPLPPGARHLLLARAHNDGFSAGNNAGIRIALRDTGCRAVWLLNNDALPRPDALDALCARMSREDRPGIVGSTLVYAHDGRTIQTLAGDRLRRVPGTVSPIGNGRRLDSVLRSPGRQAVERQLDGVTGASMLIRREVLEKAGWLDEAFFLYSEDMEFCLRARKAGFTCGWAPESVVLHKEGGTTGAESAVGARTFRRPAWVDYLGLRNRVNMARKHYPWALPLILLSYPAVMLNRARRGQAARIPLVFRAAWDGLRNRMGRPDRLFPFLRDTPARPGR